MRSARSQSVFAAGIVLSVMLGVDVLFCAPLMTFIQTWAPMLAQRMGADMGAIPTGMMAAGAGGALVAGLAAWAAIRAGASSWKSRAALLTLCGLLLLVAALWGASGSRSVLMVSALGVASFQAWSTLLYTAVADTLPVRGVSVGAAAGALIMAEVAAFSTPWQGAMMTAGGPETVFAVLAGLAAAGAVCVVLLAWFIHSDAADRPAAAPAAA